VKEFFIKKHITQLLQNAAESHSEPLEPGLHILWVRGNILANEVRSFCASENRKKEKEKHTIMDFLPA
jgi:hypothetical protein